MYRSHSSPERHKAQVRVCRSVYVFVCICAHVFRYALCPTLRRFSAATIPNVHITWQFAFDPSQRRWLQWSFVAWCLRRCTYAFVRLSFPFNRCTAAMVSFTVTVLWWIVSLVCFAKFVVWQAFVAAHKMTASSTEPWGWFQIALLMAKNTERNDILLFTQVCLMMIPGAHVSVWSGWNTCFKDECKHKYECMSFQAKPQPSSTRMSCPCFFVCSSFIVR